MCLLSGFVQQPEFTHTQSERKSPTRFQMFHQPVHSALDGPVSQREMLGNCLIREAVPHEAEDFQIQVIGTRLVTHS